MLSRATKRDGDGAVLVWASKPAVAQAGDDRKASESNAVRNMERSPDRFWNATYTNLSSDLQRNRGEEMTMSEIGVSCRHAPPRSSQGRARRVRAAGGPGGDGGALVLPDLRGAFNGLAISRNSQSRWASPAHPVEPARPAGRERDPRTRPDPADRRKIAYRLTDKGRDLLPALIARSGMWGDKGFQGCEQTRCSWIGPVGTPVAPMAVRAADGRALALSELEWLDRAELSPATRS